MAISSLCLELDIKISLYRLNLRKVMGRSQNGAASHQLRVRPVGTWVSRSPGGWQRCVPICRHGRNGQTGSGPRITFTHEDATGCAKAKSPSNCRRGSTPRSIIIGRIRTPWQRREECPKNARESDAVCTVELDPRWAKGLTGLETVSHVLLLYWMDQARRDLVLQSPRHYAEHRGTFALRSPARPESDRGLGGAAHPHRGQHAQRRRPRLPRQHAARSTSSRISLRPMPCRTPSSAGTPTANAEVVAMPAHVVKTAAASRPAESCRDRSRRR